MSTFEVIPPRTEWVAKQVIDCSIEVHRNLGPGLLESVYENCLCYELSQRKLSFTYQEKLPVVYKSIKIDAGLRFDVWVEGCVIVEVKAVEEMHPIYDAQLLSYLKLTNNRLGLLINFNVKLLKDGLKRLVL